MKDSHVKKQLIDLFNLFKRALDDKGVSVDDNTISTIRILQKFITEFVENEDYALLLQFLDIIVEYLQTDEQTNLVEVISSIELTDEQKRILKDRLVMKLGSNIHIVFTIDEKLLGGLQIKVGDKLIDLSVNKKLEILQRELMN